MNNEDIAVLAELRKTMNDAEIFIHKECCSPRIEEKVWSDYNTGEVYDTVPQTEVYCNTCEKHVNQLDIMTVEQWNEITTDEKL